MDIRKVLFSSIVLSGGSTVFAGIGERLTKDISARCPPTVKVHSPTVHCSS